MRGLSACAKPACKNESPICNTTVFGGIGGGGSSFAVFAGSAVGTGAGSDAAEETALADADNDGAGAALAGAAPKDAEGADTALADA